MVANCADLQPCTTAGRVGTFAINVANSKRHDQEEDSFICVVYCVILYINIDCSFFLFFDFLHNRKTLGLTY